MRVLPPLQAQLKITNDRFEWKAASGGYSLKVLVQDGMLDASLRLLLNNLMVSGTWSDTAASFFLSFNGERMWLSAKRENDKWLADLYEDADLIAQAELTPNSLSVTVPEDSMYDDWVMNACWTDSSLQVVLPEAPAEVMISVDEGLTASVDTEGFIADGQLSFRDGASLDAQWNMMDENGFWTLRRLAFQLNNRGVNAEYHENRQPVRTSDQRRNIQRDFSFDLDWHTPRRLFVSALKKAYGWEDHFTLI